jgi:hypothetical protein
MLVDYGGDYTMKRSSFIILLMAAALALFMVVGSFARPALATPPLQATATPEIGFGPDNPTPTAVPPVVKTPSGGGGFDGGKPPTFAPPPTLDDLIKQFPDLKPYLDKVKDLAAGQLDLAELYMQVINIYKERGASGVATFIKDSGLLEKLGIPLNYLDLLTAYDKGGLEAVSKMAHDRKLINDQDEIIGYMTVDSVDNLDKVKATLEGLGVSVYDFVLDTNEIEIGIPLDILSQFQTPGTLLGYLVQIATTEHVTGLRGPTPEITSGPALQGSASVGAQTIGADKWIAAGFTGKDVRVGVLDMGFGGIKDLLGSELPDKVKSNVSLDKLTKSENNHGTAVAAVIHGVAPDAQLFITYFDPGSNRSMQQALKFLADNKVQVVNYSVSSLVGPRDGTSSSAQMAEDFMRQTGALWVNSAGNYAMSHTSYKFNAGEHGLHYFSEDTNMLPFKPFAPNTTVIMNWDGNWSGGEDNEYDFIIVDKDGNEVVTAAEARTGKSDDYPFQIASFESTPGDIYYMVAASKSGSGENMMDIFVPDAVLVPWAQVPHYTVTTPGDADSVLTVGATGLTEDTIETYSSEGPTADERLKPDVSAPTGEKVAGYEEGFSGTSGAAPLAAGAAALVLQANPGMSAAELKSYLTTNVVDLGDSGPDSVYGAGRIALPAPEGNPDVIETPEPPAGEASATFTDISTKFNVKVKGKTGLVITVSFTLENFSGKQIVLAAIFADDKGKAIPASDKNYSIGNGVGTGVLYKVSSNQTTFEDVSLFIPNSAFAKLPKGTTRIQYIVGILDPTDPENPQKLAVSDPKAIKVK